MRNKQAVIETMLAAWPFAKDKITPQTMGTYLYVVEGIPIEQLIVVVQQIITEAREFPPPPGILLDRYRQLFGEPVDAEAEAATQWAVVRKTIQRIGYKGQPEWKDKITTDVVRIMGWRELCMSEDAGNDMVRFVRFYTALSRSARNETMLTPAFRALRDDMVRLQLEDKNGPAHQETEGST